MTQRIQFSGSVCVYRDSYGRDTLSADFVSDDKKTKFEWYKAPKSFTDIFYDKPEMGNVFNVTFTANSDGSNPRNTKLV